MENKKKILIIISAIIILTTLVLICFVNKDKIIKTARKILKLETKEITYEICSNQNNKIKLILTVTDTENPIQEIALPDGDKLISTSSRNKIAIDYVIENDGTYTFTSKSATGETMTETINVDENFRNNLIGIDKIQGISTEEDYKITKKYDGESSYKYYYAIGENNDNWVEIPDYQIVNVDEYKIKENSWADAEGKTILKVKKVSESGKNVVEIHKKIDSLTLEDDLYNDTEQTLEGDSIISCIRNNTIKSGKYRLKVNGEEYPAEIYNYNENVNYITEKNLGTSEEDNRMLIVKYNGNLNIDTDRLITAQTRKKGMFIYVAGELTNNGNVSMTARGAKAEGQNVYLWKHDNGVYEYVPAVGSAGGQSVVASNGSTKGIVGKNGRHTRTGGGGSGYATAFGQYYNPWGAPHFVYNSSRSGSGSAGTSYSGGTGGGSGYKYGDYEGTNGSPGESNGGTGGNGTYGGTGNPGGASSGTSGTGGLLILYANQFDNKGKIEANGVNSNGYGGASGGGSVNIFYNQLINEGNITAIGGNGTNGGNGGDGSISIQDINIKSPTIEATEITENSFKININNNSIKEAKYDYYIDGNLKIENTNSTEEIFGNLNPYTEYNIVVRMKYGKNIIESNILKVKTSKTLISIKLSDKFDKYIYIDSSNGSDENGDGSKNKPYATLDKIAESGIIENNYSYGIVLNDGNYELTYKVFELNCNKSINLIGDKEKTILKVNGIYSNKGGGKIDYSVNFYRLIWDGNNYNSHNVINTYTNIGFYNVSFINIATDGWTSYFCPDYQGKTQYTLNNCVLGQYVEALLRTTGGTIQLTNCYGGFTSGYSTSDSSWNYKTNYITSTPKVDSTTYQITDDDNVWKNVGTGTDPDESQASLGVFGGEYSWEYNDDIF